jgi:predicted alpha/beta superfamily hydrolase
MYQKLIKTTVVTLTLLIGPIAVANDGVLESLQSIRDSQHHELKSETLGRSLHIVVKPPRGYDPDRRKPYPVVYLLDGGALFPMLVGYYNYLLNEQVVSELFIVAISYAAVDFEHGNFRSTDYTAPTDQREWWGGAEVFQGVLEKELLPLVEANYPVDPDRRIIFGQSIGGQFVLYTALTRPDLFWGHIASNPALHRNLDFFTQRHTDQLDSGSRVFMASGSVDEDRFRKPALEWMKYWSTQENLPWDLSMQSIEGYGHFSLAPESFRQGLIWIFD